MDEELKSCPFCGSEAVFIHRIDVIGVFCKKCAAQVTRQFGIKETNEKETIINNWNKRTGV